MIFKLENKEEYFLKALAWANQQDTFMLLNGNLIEGLYSGFPVVLAVGSKKVVQGKMDGFQNLQYLLGLSESAFGYLGYDLKNEIEQLESNNQDLSGLPLYYLFIPETIISFTDNEVTISSSAPSETHNTIKSTEPYQLIDLQKINFTCDTTDKEYLQKVEKIRKHIEEGDVYELNYCIRFSAEGKIDPLSCYLKLNSSSKAPFSFILQTADFSIISSSPERFLKKSGEKVICQPMKGTAKRSADSNIDQQNKTALFESEKERAENMMIVDLTRNDLSRSCSIGSVVVEELFQVYSYQNVHQMVSTVTGKLKPTTQIEELIKNAFPMGSMTGAPKIRGMQLIDKYENSYRGAFSGAAGYFSPDGNFDLNVIIRSLFYNKNSNHLSFAVGSAITYDADPQKEYEECLLKAENIFRLFAD